VDVQKDLDAEIDPCSDLGFCTLRSQYWKSLVFQCYNTQSRQLTSMGLRVFETIDGQQVQQRLDFLKLITGIKEKLDLVVITTDGDLREIGIDVCSRCDHDDDDVVAKFFASNF
jgi:hypothetical protein